MKRGLVLSLGALALVVGGANAQAQTNNVDISLNLRYTNPGAPIQGGRWFLVAQSDAAFGVAGLSAYISNIFVADNPATPTINEAPIFGNGGVAGVGYAATTAANIGANVTTVGGTPFAATIGTAQNVVYGQDLATVVTNIGKGAGTGGNIITDPLRNNATWGNSALLMSGYFAGGGNAGNQFNRPAFVTAGANSTDANVFASATPGAAALDATVTTIVRGDSLVTLGLNSNPAAGLRFGDANRNGTVAFLSDIQPALGQIGAGSGKTWDQGDFNGNGTVSFLADIQPALGQIGLAAPPAPISAVPEPATALLGLLGLATLAIAGRRM